MKKCMLCDREARAKGFCLNHYKQYLTPGVRKYKRKNKPVIKKCKIENCEREARWNGYCHKHIAQIRRTGHILQPKIDNCIICGEKAKTKGFCSKHYILYMIPHPGYKKGERHHSYKNGNSYYKDHHTIKKMRKEYIKKNGYVCSECFSVVTPHKLQTHHKDGNKNNNDIKNIEYLCTLCHGKRKKDKPQLRLDNIHLWALALNINYSTFMTFLKKQSQQSGLSKKAILGWIIMELNTINGKSLD